MTYRREDSTGYLINWAGRLMARSLERRLSGGNVGPMPVFFALLGGGTQTQKDLATWAAVEQPTMARTLDRMERDGLIRRSPDPADGRSRLISLTQLGRERAGEAMAAAAEVNGIALSPLSAEERQLFFDLLRRIIGRLEAEGTQPPPPLPASQRDE